MTRGGRRKDRTVKNGQRMARLSAPVQPPTRRWPGGRRSPPRSRNVATRRHVVQRQHGGFIFSLSFLIAAAVMAAKVAVATAKVHGVDSALAELEALDGEPTLREYALLPAARAQLEWIHMDDYYLEPDNRHEYKGHDLLNLRVSSRLVGDLYGAVRLTNLLDEDYAERADFGFGDYRYFVGRPRQVFVELSYSFL